MPTRLLYEKICDSATLAELTGDEERLFHRLVVKADDYGRFHADPRLILGACLPQFVERIDVSTVRAWRDRLADVGLIAIYLVDGREYLQLVTWGTCQRQRGSKPKFPPPLEGAESRGDLPRDAAECGSRVVKTRGPEAGGRRPVPGGRGPGGMPPMAADATSATPAEPSHDQISDVPAAVADFHAVLEGTQGYAPSAALFDQITERYGSLDLREEALKMRSWLADPERNTRQRSATEKFILGWLKREETSVGARSAPSSHSHHTNGSNVAYDPLVGRVKSVKV